MTSVEFSIDTTGWRNRNLSGGPFVQSAKCGEPNASIFVRQDRPDEGSRQTLFDCKRDHRELTKPIEAINCRYPNTAFTILKNCVNSLARQAIACRECILSSLM